MTYPLCTLYHGSKFALEGLSEALSFEMRAIGVTVKIVEPGDVLTDVRVDFFNDYGLTEYQTVVYNFMPGYAQIKATG